jgi:transcriptional regulator with XRE-family HTH domain
MFNYHKLREIMKQKNFNQKRLAEESGILKSSISQYYSGINEPNERNLLLLAKTLGVSREYLTVTLQEPPPPPLEPEPNCLRQITVKEAARRLDISEMFLRMSLRAGKVPFGWAVEMDSGQWRYYISDRHLNDYINGGINNALPLPAANS